MSRRPLFPPVFAGGGDQPLVDDFTLRAMRQQKRSTPSAPIMQPLMLRNHPLWSGSNEFGREAAFEPDVNNRQTVLKLEECGFPMYWTVVLGLEYDRILYAQELTDDGFSVIAVIDFGIGGTTQQVEVDWNNGATVRLAMNAVVVNAEYDVLVNEDGTPLSPPSDLRLRATVCQGSIPGISPTRTFHARVDQPDDDCVIDIPQFASAVRIIANEALPADTFTFYSNVTDLVVFESNSGSGQQVASYLRSQFVEYIDSAGSRVGAPVAVPIPNGARSLTINNLRGGAALRRAIVQFDLAL